MQFSPIFGSHLLLYHSTNMLCSHHVGRSVSWYVSAGVLLAVVETIALVRYDSVDCSYLTEIPRSAPARQRMVASESLNPTVVVLIVWNHCHSPHTKETTLPKGTTLPLVQK